MTAPDICSFAVVTCLKQDLCSSIVGVISPHLMQVRYAVMPKHQGLLTSGAMYSGVPSVDLETDWSASSSEKPKSHICSQLNAREEEQQLDLLPATGVKKLLSSRPLLQSSGGAGWGI